jgi:hypothetical protein
VSDTTKRPGARDISELKARLGLKKGGPGGNGGKAAPPGARGGAIPAPPGAQPPRPAIPDASTDPFGAMNAMAAHGAVAAQPQIVIVNDGQPVESVEHKRRTVKIAVMAAAVLVPLVLGSVLGKIAAQNKAYNAAIGDAGTLRDDVNTVYKSLQNIQSVLQLARERGGGRFVVNDEQLIKDLEALALVEPSPALLTQIQLTQLPEAAASSTIELYSTTSRLNAMIKDHIRKSKADQRAYAKGRENTAQFLSKAGPGGYGALVALPPGGAEGAAVIRMVQLGPPLCEDGKPAERCAGPPTGYMYRADEGGQWASGKLGGNAGVGDKSLVVLDPDSKVLQGLVKGGEATVMEAAYLERVNSIRELLEGDSGDGGVLALGKGLQAMLQSVSNRSTKTTFFL